MAELGFGAYDADNHYYEATDAFTRYQPKGWEQRCIQWGVVNGKTRLLVGNRVCKFLPHPAFEVVAKPGVMDGYFRGKQAVDDIRTAMGELEPCRDEYRDRNVRLAVMDRQGLDGAFFFPTLGVGIEEFMRDDPEACAVAFHSFNQWLFDDWGFGADGRIFGVPYIPLGVPDRAVEMLQWALDHGAKAFNMRAAPVATFRGETHSPADPRLDRFWGLVNESGILCAIHSGDSGYLKYANDWEPQTHFEAFRQNPFAALFMADRSSMDVCAALISHRLFERFPNVKVLTVESGSMWVPELFRRFKKVFSQNPKAFAEDPRLTFQRHIYVSPFFEDDIPGLVELIGTDHVLFGSDYPHVEGLAEPTDYVFDLKGLDDLQIRMIMRDNFRNLLGLA